MIRPREDRGEDSKRTYKRPAAGEKPQPPFRARKRPIRQPLSANDNSQAWKKSEVTHGYALFIQDGSRSAENIEAPACCKYYLIVADNADATRVAEALDTHSINDEGFQRRTAQLPNENCANLPKERDYREHNDNDLITYPHRPDCSALPAAALDFCGTSSPPALDLCMV